MLACAADYLSLGSSVSEARSVTQRQVCSQKKGRQNKIGVSVHGEALALASSLLVNVSAAMQSVLIWRLVLLWQALEHGEHGWGARPGGAGRAPLARGPTPPRAHPRPQRPNGSKWLPVEAALSLSLSLYY